MTLKDERDKAYEKSFAEYEKNRMYPPTQRRIPMLTVSDSHLKAVARAVHFVRSGITTTMTAKLRDSIDRDIELLDQVHKFCRQQIVEPGLPMSPESTGQGNNGEKDG